MKFKNLVSAVICGMMCISCMTVSATNSTNYAPISEEQKTEADAVLSAFCEELAGAQNYSVRTSTHTEGNPTGYQVENGFYVHHVSFYSENYENAVSANATFLPGARWFLIPYSNEDCCGVYTLREIDGKLEFYTQTIEKQIQNPLIRYNAEIQEIIETNFDSDDIVYVRYLYDNSINFYAVQIKTASNSYIIPYFVSPDFDYYTGITQGMLYTESDFRNWVSSSFEKASAYNEHGESLIGGMSYNFVGGMELMAVSPAKETDVQPWFWITASGTALIIAGVFFVAKHKKTNVFSSLS